MFWASEIQRSAGCCLCRNESVEVFFFHFLKSMLTKYCINKQSQAKMEYLKLGLLTWFTNICKPLAVQPIFPRAGEIHLNKNICAAVRCAELCLRGLAGHHFCGGRTVCVIKALIHYFFLFFFFPMPLPFFCRFYLQHFHLKTAWLFSGVSEHRNVWTAQGPFFFSNIQGLWHFGLFLMAYSFLPEILSLGAEETWAFLREHLWRVRGGPLSCRESHRPFLCDWEILIPWWPIAPEPGYLGFAPCFGRTKACEVREWVLSVDPPC